MKAITWNAILALILSGCGTESGSEDVFDAGTDSGFEDVQAPVDVGNETDLPNLPDHPDLPDLPDFSDLTETLSEIGPPPDINDVPQELPQDNVTGTPCWDDQCPEGYLCLAEPCMMCGMPPEPVCVPEPCPFDGCWFDWDCAPNQVCVGAAFPYGPHGQCLPQVPPPQCWEDADCPDTTECVGALHCPPCYACGMPWNPGTCQAKEGEDKVLLWVDDAYYLPGSTVHPVWYNLDDTTIFLAGCITFTIEQSNGDGTWKDLGAPAICGWEGIAVKVEPGGAHQAFSFQTPAQEPDGYGTYRLRGLFWTGCLDDQPISEALCKGGPVDVLSNLYSVGPPPPQPPR